MSRRLVFISRPIQLRDLPGMGRSTASEGDERGPRSYHVWPGPKFRVGPTQLLENAEVEEESTN